MSTAVDMNVEAKKGVLKHLIRKMHKMEVDSYKKGEGPKPKPMLKAVKEEPKAKKEEPKKKDDDFSKSVKGFFQGFSDRDEKKEESGFFYKRRKASASTPETPKKKRRRRRKKVVAHDSNSGQNTSRG